MQLKRNKLLASAVDNKERGDKVILKFDEQVINDSTYEWDEDRQERVPLPNRRARTQ